MSKKALIVVDIQYDFIDGGALAVPKGQEIVPIVSHLIEFGQFDLVIATQDWHPANHGSFAANHPGKSIGEVIDLNGLPQILWPTHCVQGTNGANLHADLPQQKIDKVVRKGTDSAIDSYSGFFDNGHRKSTGLADYLRDHNIAETYIVGLAADYCVKFTALDSVQQGFKTYLFTDATKGVNLSPQDTDLAFEEMKQKGIGLLTSELYLSGL